MRDGQPVTLRCVRASDKELLREGFARMSPESRYRRFFTAKTHLTERELSYLTDIDGVDHFAIGATRPRGDPSGDDEEGLGVARFIRLADRPDTVEAAIAVVDDMHGNGLGSALFHRLLAAATERGVRRVYSEILADNEPMKEFMRFVAPHATFTYQGNLARCEFALPEPARDPQPEEESRRSPLYAVLKLTAEGRLQPRHWLTRLGLVDTDAHAEREHSERDAAKREHSGDSDDDDGEPGDAG